MVPHEGERLIVEAIKDFRADGLTYRQIAQSYWLLADHARVTVDICLFSIEFKNTKPLHSYGGRRAYRLVFCKGLEKRWTWEQFKTSKGCESYFQRSCSK